MIIDRSPLRILAAAALIGLCGCASSEPQRGATALNESSAEAARSETNRAVQLAERSESLADTLTEIHVDSQVWEFAGIRGQVIRTANYEVYTTIRRPQILDRLPLFLERVLLHYTSALAELPVPDKPLQMYLLATRSEWEAKTKQMLPDQADTYLKLGRGGFTTQGTAILYDIGWRDTLAIAAHEGWHQYTQQMFQNALPVWLEEGIATYMEGHINSSGPPQFRPWANYERFSALSQTVRSDRLIPLNELLKRTPQTFLTSSKDDLLSYYAQVWALVHFMASGEEGRYAAALSEVLEDAAAGRLAQRIIRSEVIGRRERRVSNSLNLGPAVIQEYFNSNLVEFQSQYEGFVNQVVAHRGARGRIFRGLDPREDR